MAPFERPMPAALHTRRSAGVLFVLTSVLAVNNMRNQLSLRNCTAYLALPNMQLQCLTSAQVQRTSTDLNHQASQSHQSRPQRVLPAKRGLTSSYNVSYISQVNADAVLQQQMLVATWCGMTFPVLCSAYMMMASRSTGCACLKTWLCGKGNLYT